MLPRFVSHLFSLTAALIVLMLIATWDLKSTFSYELIYTWPICHNSAHRSTWCRAGERKQSHYDQKIYDRLFASFTDETFSEIFISSFSSGSLELLRFLCAQNKKGAKIEMVLDSQNDHASSLNLLTAKCAVPVELRSKIYGLGSLDPWNLMHSKVMLFDNPLRDYLTVIIGSGNSSFQSFNITFNNWLKIRAPRTSSFAKQHICLKRALLAAATGNSRSAEKRKAQYASVLRACRTRSKTLPFQTALNNEGIAPIFTLNNEDKPRDWILGAIDEVPANQEILAVTQLFTSKLWAAALLRAAERGVKVRMIVDGSTLTATESSRGNSADFYRNYLQQNLIKIRFIETNPAIDQMMHMKFMVLGDGVMFTGSGQFSVAALNKNYENFYAISDKGTIDQHRALFDKLWQAAFDAPADSQPRR